VSQLVFERLVELVEHPFFSACGYHACDIGWCGFLDRSQPSFRYKGRLLWLGNTDIIVPGNGVVYSAPTLILHYIRRHKYLPPSCFNEAVLNCPTAGSSEHAAAIRRITPALPLIPSP